MAQQGDMQGGQGYAGGSQMGGSGQMAGQGLDTGVDNTTYDLISVLYHSLDSTSVMQRYLQDAQGDQDVRQLFQMAINNNQQLVQQARQLLQKRLGQP